MIDRTFPEAVFTRPASRAERAPTIAILEDERIFRDGVEQLLPRYGMRVVAACASAGELQAALRREVPDLILLDVRGPAGAADGEAAWILLRSLKERFRSARLVVVSSALSALDVDRCRAEGVAGVLHKHALSGEQLAESLRRVLGGERIFPLVMPALGQPLPSRPLPEPLQGLTQRELQVLSHVAAGSDNQHIGVALKITERTVRAHVSALYRKLGSQNRAQLALLGRDLGLRIPS